MSEFHDYDTCMYYMPVSQFVKYVRSRGCNFKWSYLKVKRDIFADFFLDETKVDWGSFKSEMECDRAIRELIMEKLA